MQKEWCIIVAQIVTGHSKFPHSKVGKFERFKPWPYRDSSKPHRIIYAKKFLASPEEALNVAKKVDQEMFQTYVMGMGNTSYTCVSDYTVVLHDVTSNVSTQMSSTIHDDESAKPNFLYSGGVICNNSNLGVWGIIKGLK